MKQVEEFERKFILAHIPNNIELLKNKTFIRQLYLPDKTRYRLTIDSYLNESVEAIKKIRKENGHNIEIECGKITTQQFTDLWNKSKLKITKTRYQFTNNKQQTFFVDDFNYINLIILEVETNKFNEKIYFPEWLKPYIICEVTDKKEFSNHNIAKQINKIVNG